MIFAAHRYHFIVIASLVIFSAFLFFQRNENVFPVSFSGKLHSTPKPDITDTFANLFRPIKLSPTHPGYRDASGRYISGAPANEAIWTRPLGKKLLIVDIDTRTPTGENQIFNTEKKINWEKLEYRDAGIVTGGISLHYLYAMIHGYDYMHYQALEMEDMHQTWIKPHVFKELLPDYEFVVFFDADSVVSHLEIPLEWMFNRWGITENTMIAMPHDTEEWRNGVAVSTDSTGLPVQNSGFVVLQNSSLTLDMLSAWADCPTEERYEGCGEWKDKWSHEQRAFAEYIRHDPAFNVSADSIVEIPCDDAMGWEGFKKEVESGKDDHIISDCNGRLVRHYTLKKDQLKEEGTVIVMQSLMEILQKSIIKHQAATYKKEHDPTMVSDDDEDIDYDKIEKLNSAKIPGKSTDTEKTSSKVPEEDKSKHEPEKIDDEMIEAGDEEEDDDDEYTEEEEEKEGVNTVGAVTSQTSEGITNKDASEEEAKEREEESEKKEQELKKQEKELKEKEEALKKKEEKFKKAEEEFKKKEEKARKKNEEEEAEKEAEKKKKEDAEEEGSKKEGSEKEEVRKKGD